MGLAEGGESCFGGVEVSLERSELGSGFVDEMGGCIVDIPGVGKTAFEPSDLAAQLVGLLGEAIDLGSSIGGIDHVRQAELFAFEHQRAGASGSVADLDECDTGE